MTARQSVAVTREQVDLVLRRFTGNIEQTPPMYSALKRDGKPLYAYARAGLTLAISPRTIIIHGITLRHFAADRVQISVRCSKGTYIRTLAEDVGRVLGCGATLAGLRRTAVGTFEVKSAVTLTRLEALPATQRLACLLAVVACCPRCLNCCSNRNWCGVWLTGSGARSRPRAPRLRAALT